MRVAVSQFATSSNVQENLATCIRMINEAAACKPDLIVLPEFCNTLFFNSEFCDTQPSYVDHNQAWNEALAINGTFLQSIAEQAKKHGCYIVLGVTLRRDLSCNFSNIKQDGLIQSKIQSKTKPTISITSCLFSSLGDLIHQADKQTLMGHENEYFSSASEMSEVVKTPFGTLGLLTGSDGITFEASRGLVLRGAKLLCHSMSSLALDQSHLHGPARACENKVFLAAANKVGLLVPQGTSQEKTPNENGAIFSTQSVIPQEYLVGVGQSQIISPDGKVLTKLTNNEEGFVFADIDLAECDTNKNKYRPDGTEIIKQRRPELYQEQTFSLKKKNKLEIDHNGEGSMVPITANVAIFATYKSNEQAIEDVCHYIENNLSDIIQLPELFFMANKTTINTVETRLHIECLSKQLINQESLVLRPFQYVCTSLVIDDSHQAVLISEHGLFATQQQLHFCQRYHWTTLSDVVSIIELHLEQGNINVAMLTADDANIPEIVKVAALKNIHLLLVPFDIQEPSEVEFKLLALATENRICIVAASREKNFSHNLSTVNSKANNMKKIKPQKSTGLITSLTTEHALLTSWKSLKFDGFINPPRVKHQHGKITKAIIHPIAACDKRMATKNI
jgi:predicted amidohydrolase